MFKIEFEPPHHGWMPVKIVCENKEEYFDVSDVPVNPVSQLADVLDSVLTGGWGEVWWHLEPAGYYLKLEADNGAYRVQLDYSVNSMKQNREQVFEFKGNFEEIIVPIWRSLRKLQSYKWDQFEVSDTVMESISKQVKSK